MNDGKYFFDLLIKKDLRLYDDICKITTDQRHDYITDFLLDCPYFKEHKVIPIDLGKQQALDADPKPIEQIDITGNLAHNGNT